MSLFRAVRQFQGLSRQSVRLATVQQQQKRFNSEMSFTFAAPGNVYYNQEVVKQVDVPSWSGNFGILAEHVPTIAVLKPGLVTVHETSGKEQKFFVSSGSVSVNDDSSLQVLCEEAVRIEDLDSAAIRESLSKANSELASATTEEAKAEAQIAVECCEALAKAIE